MKMISCPSPNFDDRAGGQDPTMIIIHYTGTLTASDAKDIFICPDAVGSFGRVSPHYMIDDNSQVLKFIEEEKRAWHAGKSSWGNITDINSASIGIEIWNTGHEHNLEEFIPEQIDVLIRLIKEIRTRWNIPDKNIVGHSDIASGRKLDPGEKFPWKKLANAGIGNMPNNKILPEHVKGDNNSFFTNLKSYGYSYPADNDILLTEFRRHFLPHLLGVEDVTQEDITALFDISS